MQACPWLWKMAHALPLTAAGRKASSNTMFGPLPPSSSCTFFRLPALACTTRRPVAVLPVKAIFAMSGCSAMYWPTTWPSPGTMLTTPSGMPASAISSTILQRAERRDLRRLHHDAVAGRERGRHLPAREHQREVPRHHLADDADRLAQRVVEEAGLDRNGLALELVGHAAEVAEARRRARHVELARIAHRMAGVQRFEPREFLGVGLDQVREPEQDAPAVGRRHAAPGREGALRRGHGLVDVGLAGQRHVGDGRVVVRVQRGQRLARFGIDEAPVDEELVPDGRLQAGGLLDVCEGHGRVDFNH